MTLYSVLVADSELQTIDCTGIKEMTIRELKILYPITNDTPIQHWHSMDDDVRIIHAPDEAAFAQLVIFEWQEPPYDLELYHKKPYVYGIGGNWGPQFLDDFLIYLKQHIKPEHNVELIRFWAGEAERRLKRRSIHIEEIELHHLEKLEKEQYIRVALI
ncbi:hypothetical protein ACIQXI_07390 [Lysinibacillus sp. NPDC097195]|uniref:hypothetical protein n=1 Tax=Lysinibacillus sp. NPDC097195 TaxID=3364141 RepID=UPI0038265CC8